MEKYVIPEGIVDELPIDKVKDEKFNAWMQSITFAAPDGTLEDMEWKRSEEDLIEEED